MPNQRNVAALEALLTRAAEGSIGAVPPPFQEMLEQPLRETIVHVARYLSDEGVLVPSILTEEEAVKIGADAASTAPSDRSEIALRVREGLERVARGGA